MKTNSALFAVCLFAFTCGMSAFGVNRYVSPDGSWKPEGDATITHATVNDAISKANPGDTVYIQDGTVIDSGTGGTAVGYIYSRIYCSKAITISSYSGDADESKGHGVYLVGEKGRPEATTIVDSLDDKTGANSHAIRGLASDGNAKFVGFICSGGCTYKGQNGYTYSYSHGGGGAMVTGNAVFENCIFRNNVAGYGGGVYSRATSTDNMPTFRNCVITNNVAVYSAAGGGGLARYENCLIANNTLSGTGATSATECGGVRGRENESRAVLVNCTVASNDSTRGHCGGVMYATCSNVVICGNVVTNGNGGGAYYSSLTDCQVIGNEVYSQTSSSAGDGAGLCYSTATNCTISANVNRGQYADGAGAYSCQLVGCDINCNTTENVGAGICFGAGDFCRNCVITNNCSLNSASGAYGAGTLSNCLIAGNVGRNPNGFSLFAAGASGVKTWSGPEGARIVLENCTVVSNVTVTGKSGCKPFGGVWHAKMVNTISWDNGTDNAGKQDGDISEATNCCCAVLTDKEAYPGCISSDPKFLGKGEFPYALRMHSPCKDTALELPWMSDAADPRSTALDGHARILGKGPDMGCYEHLPLGLLFMVK